MCSICMRFIQPPRFTGLSAGKGPFPLLFLILLACLPFTDSFADNIEVGSSSGRIQKYDLGNPKYKELFELRIGFQPGDHFEYKLPEYDDSGWTELTEFPHNWRDPRSPGASPGDTFGWYRLRLKPLKAFGAGKNLMFELGPISDADQVFFNGVLIGESGEIAPGAKRPRKSAYDSIRFYSIPSGLIRAEGDNVLAIRVQALFENVGGFVRSGSVHLGREQFILEAFFIQNMLGLITVITILTVAGYFLLLYSRRRFTYENLWFGISCVCFAVYFVLRSHLKYYLFGDYLFLKRLEFMFVFIIMYPMALFLYYYFPRNMESRSARIRKALLPLCLIIPVTLALITALTDDIIFWKKLNIYVNWPLWSIPALIVLWILIENLFKKSPDAFKMLLGIIVSLALAFNDMLVNQELLPWDVQIGHFGFLTFILFFAAILANRFVRLHREVENLNLNLEQRVHERTSELGQALDKLNLARGETEKILNTVGEGLFLIHRGDAGYFLGKEYSKAVELIFEDLYDEIVQFDEKHDLNLFAAENLAPEARENIIHEFRMILGRSFGLQALEAGDEYLQLLFNPVVDDELTQEVNPFMQVQFNSREPSTGWLKEKHLQFRFNRIREAEGIKHIMVQVQDVSQEILLRRELEEKDEQTQGQMERLFSILQVEPEMLVQFIEDTQTDLDLMRERISSIKNGEEYQPNISAIFRFIHTCKGNADLLGLNFFSFRAHIFEEELKEFYRLNNPDDITMDRLETQTRDLREVLGEVRDLVTRIGTFKEKYDSSVRGKNGVRGLIVGGVESCLRNISRRVDKEIIFICENFPSERVPPRYRKSIRDIMVQLARNAVIHGIEEPDRRRELKKPGRGRVELSARLQNGPGGSPIQDQKELVAGKTWFSFSFSDDGAGLDLTKIKARALELSLITPEEASKLSREQIAELIFKPGLTTTDKVSMDAGRGVGMDIIHQEVSDMGGRITINTRTDIGCEFRVEVPI